MNGEGLAVQHQQMVNFEDYAMDSNAVVRQVHLVQEVMNKVMKKDEHYGIIPGCQKPSLLKPGAEKLGFTFRLAPEYDVKIINMGGAHREYQVKCKLRHIPTGAMVGEGDGSCTTMEGKFRFRGGDKTPTENPVPKEYWNAKSAGDMTKAKEIIGGEGYGVMKDNGKWVICELGEKVEHDNPADYYNTCLKMAKKRAHVDAILTATAASDIFTQDVEDMTEVIDQPAEKKPVEKKPDPKQPQSKSAQEILSVNFIPQEVTQKDGKKKDGNSYTIYFIKGPNAEYNTFDKKFADAAYAAKENDALICVTYKVTKFGNEIETVGEPDYSEGNNA